MTDTDFAERLSEGQSAQIMRHKPELHPNLLRRPAKPALGAGRVQTQCRRCFYAFEGVISTSDAISWAYPWAERRPNGLNVSARRALVSIGAQRVGRASTIGRPWLWRLPSMQHDATR
jgi:hypothetical protein